MIKDPPSEGEMDLASESDTKILNSVQKHLQILYIVYTVFCETCVNNSFRTGVNMSRWLYVTHWAKTRRFRKILIYHKIVLKHMGKTTGSN